MIIHCVLCVGLADNNFFKFLNFVALTGYSKIVKYFIIYNQKSEQCL
jgi:hypothetical protein